MKLNALNTITRPETLTPGLHKVKFKEIEYITNEADDITGYRIHIEGFAPIFGKWFDENNWALDAFLAQLNENSYMPAAINKHAGTEITVEMKQNGQYLNANFRISRGRTYR